MKKYDAIFGADFHIRETTPENRMDDFISAQWKKLSFIQKLCFDNECPLLIAGDLFDHWKASPYLLSKCIELLPDVIMIPGQHDMQNHTLENELKTAYNVLKKTGAIKPLTGGRSLNIGRSTAVFGYAYGEDSLVINKTSEKTIKKTKNHRKIVMLHTLVCEAKQPWKDAGAYVSKNLLSKINADVILTGDNHQQFVIKKEGKILINPGSIMRTSIDQKNFEPAVFGWKAEDNSVHKIPLPIEKDVFYIVGNKEKKDDRDKRMIAYITRAKKSFELSFSIIQNMKSFLKKNKTSESIKKYIWEAFDEQ